MRSAESRKVNVLDMKRLKSLVGVSLICGIRNEEVCKRAGIERELASRVDQTVLRSFGHVERIEEYRIPRRLPMAEEVETGYRVDRDKVDGWC